MGTHPWPLHFEAEVKRVASGFWGYLALQKAEVCLSHVHAQDTRHYGKGGYYVLYSFVTTGGSNDCQGIPSIFKSLLRKFQRLTGKFKEPIRGSFCLTPVTARFTVQPLKDC